VKELELARSANHSCRYWLTQWSDANVGTLFRSEEVDAALTLLDDLTQIICKGIQEVQDAVYA